MRLEIFEDGFDNPSKADTFSTHQLVTSTYFLALIHSLDGYQKKNIPFAFFVLKEMLFTSFSKVGLLSQRLREFTSLHMKQQKVDRVDKEYPGSAQRQMDYFKGLEQSRGRGWGVGEECQHLAFSGSCHKVTKGLGRVGGSLGSVPQWQQPAPVKPGNQIAGLFSLIYIFKTTSLQRTSFLSTTTWKEVIVREGSFPSALSSGKGWEEMALRCAREGSD